jgi:hypothetical protein
MWITSCLWWLGRLLLECSSTQLVMYPKTLSMRSSGTSITSSNTPRPSSSGVNTERRMCRTVHGEEWTVVLECGHAPTHEFGSDQHFNPNSQCSFLKTSRGSDEAGGLMPLYHLGSRGSPPPPQMLRRNNEKGEEGTRKSRRKETQRQKV